MSEINNSSRIGVYIGDDLLARCDAAMEKTNAESRSEFIRDALEHYIAVINMQESSKVLTPALESVIGSKIALTASSGRRSRKRSRPTVSDPVVMNMTTVKGRPCNQYRRTAPCSVVRRYLTKRNKQLKPLGEVKTFSGLKIPPYVVVSHRRVSTTYGGRESRFGFAAVFKGENKVGIDKNISVGYKGE